MSAPADLLLDTNRLIDAALAEDIGADDWTTLWTFPPETRGTARVVAKSAGVIAGSEIARAVFQRLDPALAVDIRAADGISVAPGDEVLTVCGTARGILTAERVALNFLQRLSGVATHTKRFVDAVAGTGAHILDTRKTTPLLRGLEKAAVRAGGGMNHRVGLYDMVLIKDNHIAAAGGIVAAVDAVRRRNAHGLRVEVEAASLAQVDEALAAGVDRIMFDNMPLPMLRDAVRRVRAHAGPRPETEASGSTTLEAVRAVAETGVDFISVGALTHSAPALDLSLRFTADPRA